MDKQGWNGVRMTNDKDLKIKIDELEDKIKQQREEMDKLNKKAKRSSFWLFWLLNDKENSN